MDNTLSLWLSLSIILPVLITMLSVLVYMQLKLRRELKLAKQKMREGTLKRNHKRLYLIDTERK
jgi:hypothetical protein